MISGFRIFLGGCSLYLACGISYLLYVGWRVNNTTIGELIKLIKKPPIYMTILNVLFRPLVLIKLKFYEIIDKCEKEGEEWEDDIRSDKRNERSEEL